MQTTTMMIFTKQPQGCLLPCGFQEQTKEITRSFQTEDGKQQLGWTLQRELHILVLKRGDALCNVHDILARKKGNGPGSFCICLPDGICLLVWAYRHRWIDHSCMLHAEVFVSVLGTCVMFAPQTLLTLD